MREIVVQNEALRYRLLSDELRDAYGNIDEETLRDTLEGISELPALIEEIVRSSLDDEAMITGLKTRVDAMATRLTRLRERHQKKRKLAAWALGSAGLAKLAADDFSVTLSEGVLRLEINDESKLGIEYLIPQPPKPDRAAISAALKQGAVLEGASLVQGQPYITVSIR
jgi:hypothetical protein